MVEIAQTRRLHPRHGVHDQRAQTPDRAPNSVRRTTWIDSFRFDGPAGPTTMLGSGRDLFTPAAGEPRVLATAEVEVVLAPLHGVVAEVRKPSAYDALVGAAVPAGWRRAPRRTTCVGRNSRSSSQPFSRSQSITVLPC